MTEHNGGCHCGKVKFTAKDPIISVACNCQRCRKLSGSLHLGVIFSEENGARFPAFYELLPFYGDWD